MKKVLIFSRSLLCSVLLLAGCSAGWVDKLTDGFAADPLSYTAVSKTLLTARNYFISYSPSSGRFGVIDADSFEELWGLYLQKSISDIFNLPGYEGAGFFEAGAFSVVISEGKRTFFAPGVGQSTWNRASSVIAVAGYSVDDRKIHIVRHRGEDKWEQSEITAFDEQSLPVKSRVVMGAEGQIIVALDPESGSYAVVVEQEGAYVLRRSCSHVGLLGLSSAVIDEPGEQLYVAAEKQILRIDVSDAAPCQDPKSWVEIEKTDRRFTKIGLLGEGQLYAIEDSEKSILGAPAEGTIHVLTRTGGVMASSRTFSSDCEEPSGVNRFGDGLVVTCLKRKQGLIGSMLSSASLNVFSADDQLLMSKDISFQNKAGIVFNSDLLQINEVLDSAAGEVWITDVVSQASRKVTGIYLDRILDRL